MVGFGVFFNILCCVVNFSGWVGVVGWFMYEVFYYILLLGIDVKFVIGNFVVVIVIGVVSGMVVCYKWMLMIIFNIFSLVLLVFGG